MLSGRSGSCGQRDKCPTRTDQKSFSPVAWDKQHKPFISTNSNHCVHPEAGQSFRNQIFFLLRTALNYCPQGHFCTGPTWAIFVPLFGDPRECRGDVAFRPLLAHAPAFSGAQKRAGIPNKGEQNQNLLPHPCLLGGPREGGNATSPLRSRRSPTKGNKIRIGCLTPAFSGDSY